MAIKKMLNEGVSHGKIAEWFGVTRSAVSMISEGRTWREALTGEELTKKEKV
jgi:predicted transcriptional regulator